MAKTFQVNKTKGYIHKRGNYTYYAITCNFNTIDKLAWLLQNKFNSVKIVAKQEHLFPMSKTYYEIQCF